MWRNCVRCWTLRRVGRTVGQDEGGEVACGPGRQQRNRSGAAGLPGLAARQQAAVKQAGNRQVRSAAQENQPRVSTTIRRRG